MSVSLIDGHIDRNEQEMTDEDIVKALECCSVASFTTCHDCPYGENQFKNHCSFTLSGDALDLINRQKAEIEALIAGQETLQKTLKESQHEAKYFFTERQSLNKQIVKEFAKSVINDILPEHTKGHEEMALRISLAISQKAKEMAGVDDNAE